MSALAVLVSGTGTNLAAIINHAIPVTIVIAERPCEALKIAAAANVPVALIERKNFGYRQGIGDAWDRRGFTEAVMATLASHHVDLVAMAGFATIFHPVFFERYRGQVLNTHPSLLPAFPGRGAQAVHDALATGLTETGCTVHIATEVLDDARFVVEQARVPILRTDSDASLWERIKQTERELYPRVIRDVMAGRINLPQLMKV